MEYLKNVPDTVDADYVRESLIHHSKITKTLQPYMTKMPRKDKYSYWTNRENYTLAMGIEQYGTADFDKLVEVVQTKTVD